MTEFELEWAERHGYDAPSHRKKLAQYYSGLKMWLIATRGPSCEACGVMLPTAKDAGKHLVTHHILPKANGGGDGADNLILLCGDCHSSQHDFRLRGKARPTLPAGVCRPAQEDRYLSLAQLVDAAIDRRKLAHGRAAVDE